MAETTETEVKIPLPTMLAQPDNADPGDEAPDAHGGGDHEVETRARALGWRPENEFKGDKRKWKPAKEFLEYGEHIVPVVKQNLNVALDKISKLENRLAQRERDIEEMRNLAAAGEKRAYERAIADLKAEKAQAIKDGDGDRVVDIDAALDALKEQPAKAAKKPEPTETGVAQPTPEQIEQYTRQLQAWEAENPWTKDRTKQIYGEGVAARLRREGERSTGIEFLEKVKERVQELMPEWFQDERRAGGGAVEGGGTGGGTSRSGDRLSQEQQSAFQRFVRMGLFKDTPADRKRYLQYYAEQG